MPVAASRLLLIILLFVIWPAHTCSAETKAVLLSHPNGTEIYSINKTAPMVPASTLKLLTSLAALKALGPTYRFPTLVAYDRETHRLFLKGFGDPLLISEELKRLADKIITEMKPDRITGIVIDTSFFNPDIAIPGTGGSKNPYDATTGALCANFNTFRFRWSQSDKSFISAESQTPFFDIFKKDILASGLKEGRILLSEPLRKQYPGLLLAHFLKQGHIPVSGNVVAGTFCDTCLPVVTFESAFTIAQAVGKLLTFSNNFIANQIMLAMGARTYGPPATLEKGVRVLRQFAADQLLLRDIRLAEGSGLSRKNRISSGQMLRVLIAFKPYYRLLRQEGKDFFKTGTLSDVRARAGYLMGEDGKLYPYVIMLNSTHRGVEGILRQLKQKVYRISSGKG